ncbi:MAG: hypothetical protein K2N99_02950 [Malacoplasma sp.]|nr:hypothetical protein [Malacoplasma sp.]
MIEYIPETNELVMTKNDYLRLDTGYYKYIGKVQKLCEVPKTNCLYVIDENLFVRRVDLQKLNALKAIQTPIKEVDDSDELDLEVKPGDDSTLVIVKELLKGFTKNTFRKLFDNDSDMNNMRRAIEKSPNGQLSLNRFKLILEKLGLRYKIIVFSDDLNPTSSEFDKKIERINSDSVTVGSIDNEEEDDVNGDD